MSVESDIKSGWDIRIQCQGCGRRYRRHRDDHGISSSDEVPATVTVGCYECEAYTVHFVDYVNEADVKEEASCRGTKTFTR